MTQILFRLSVRPFLMSCVDVARVSDALSAGVALQQKPWLCVLEFMQYGDLRSVLMDCLEKNILLQPYEQVSALDMLHTTLRLAFDHCLCVSVELTCM